MVFPFARLAICASLVSLLTFCAKRTAPSAEGEAETPITDSLCTDSWSGVNEFGVATKNVYIESSAVDASCNLYVGGYTDASLHGNALIGTSDLFVIKYNSAGTREWTKKLGVAGASTYGLAIATDTAGDVYITGYTTGSLDGNSITGNFDLFIVKYDSDGEKQWSELLGVAAESTYAFDIVTDLSDNVIIVGETSGAVDSNVLIGTSDILVAKYDSAGTKLWTKQVGGVGTQSVGMAVAVDLSLNIFLVGYTDGNFDGNSLVGSQDFVLVKYNSDGAKQWSRQVGDAAVATLGWGVAADSSGNIFATGTTSGALPGATQVGATDLFIMKYNTSGAKLWTRQAGGPAANIVFTSNTTTTDATGDFYVTGSIDTAGMDGNALIGTVDGFLTKYNGEGTRQWTAEIGSSDVSAGIYPTAISINDGGSVFLSGYADGPLPGQTLSGTSDAFISKFNSSGTQQ
jgi:hypothetical protein